MGIISKGDLDYTIRSMRNAEFTTLEQSINLMIRKIREESEELERKNAELKAAARSSRVFSRKPSNRSPVLTWPH